MKIRFATMDDIPECVELGRKFQALTRFKAYEFNPKRVADNLTAVIQNERNNYVFFVAEDSEGVLVGALIACLERHFFSDQLVASVIHYDVLPERRMSGAGLRLMIAFKKWAENRGVFEISAGVNSGADIAKLDRYMKRLGFENVGGNYSLLIGQR